MEAWSAMNTEFDLAQLRVAPSLHWTEEFAAWLYHNERMPKTIDAYLQDLRHFSKFFTRVNDQAFMPELLNATDVKAYFARQDADHSVKPASRNRRLFSLRVMVKWAVEAGLLEYDPTVSVKRQPVELTPRDRTVEEMERLSAVVLSGSHIKCAGQFHAWLALRDRILWALFTDTGLRIHEVASLQVGDIDFDGLHINVLGKGNKKAPINVPARLIEMLASFVDLKTVSAERTLITDWNRQAITTGQIRVRIKMIGEAAGIHDLKPHDLRHTYAYLLLETLIQKGMSVPAALDALRKQMRHADQKTTILYFAARDSQVRAAVEAM